MLQGEKVRLRAPERIDIPAFLRWINDQEVTEFLDIEPPMGMEQEEAWFESLRNSDIEVFSIETKEGELIGNIGLMKFDWVSRKVTMGIVIGEKVHWGSGYGSDAIMTLLSYLFEELNINRVHLEVDTANQRAVHCYEKCGFVKEGILRQVRWKRGRFKDNYIMSILREEWESKHSNRR
ncbi:MAG: GNAT family N-acetyltransferase [Methanomassiliicoccales archaeon]|nr:GNAT family N-acetyltransferase [Methanomassiliicoccales archaeon]NYT14731.1 GNAT family N-acetyltransferase [Methanomassiliicoccales archaeon]